MPQKPPIALIVFSNDLDDYLSNIETERKIIEEALEHYDDTNRLKVITRSSVSIDELFRLFNKYSGRIALFHFAGHAGGNGLQFSESVENIEIGNAKGIAGLIQREVTDGILKFVFLNGCSTAGQVEGLKAVGVPSIIATHYPIQDNKAIQLAKVFYRTWAKSDDLSTAFDSPLANIQTAFKNAVAYVKTKFSIPTETQTRGFVLNPTEMKTDIAWELFTTNPEQTLNVDIAQESKTFNEFLVRRLTEKLEPYSKPAARFLPIANKKALDWETQLNISNQAKKIIVFSLVGVLGIQLQKLFAIGNENTVIELKQRKYVEHSLFAAKRTLKLVNFTLLSKLWDYRASPNDLGFTLTEAQQDSIKHFFEDDFEMDILAHFNFLKNLHQVYKDNNLEFPISGFEQVEKALEKDSTFANACEKLQVINQAFDKSQTGLSDCFKAEKQLVIILETFLFFSAYKIVSIRQIAYDEMRNQAPRYIHTYTEIGIDAKQNINGEKILADNKPITTDAILLHQKDYQISINLFPFIIDLHTLTFETKANICFYDSKDFNDGSLNYRFLQDNKIKNITFSDTMNKEAIVADVVGDKQQFTASKLDLVYTQFYEAKQAILGAAAEAKNTDEDDFGGLFDDL